MITAFFGLPTSAGFRRITTNCSARCIKKLVNLWHRIVSISSACFTAMLIRTLLTLVSMRHLSCSLRQIVTGLRRSSLLDLRAERTNKGRRLLCYAPDSRVKSPTDHNLDPSGKQRNIAANQTGGFDSGTAGNRKNIKEPTTGVGCRLKTEGSWGLE